MLEIETPQRILQGGLELLQKFINEAFLLGELIVLSIILI